MFAFSTLFSATVVAASFDVAIERDAMNGRINHEFQAMLLVHYGIDLPASPAMAIRFANEFLTQDKAPKLASGPGARAAAPAVAQALRAVVYALHDAGKAKNLPAIAALPAWADPVQIEAKAKAAAEKRAATKAEKAAAAPVAATVTAPAATVTAPAATVTAPAAPATAPVAAPGAAPITAALADSVQAVIAAARGGFLTAAQIAALRAALDTAAATPQSVPTSRKGGKVTAPAATIAEPALL